MELHRYAKQMERAVLEREKQARLDAEAQKVEMAARLKAFEEQYEDQIRKLFELEQQAKALEDEKEEKVRFVRSLNSVSEYHGYTGVEDDRTELPTQASARGDAGNHQSDQEQGRGQRHFGEEGQRDGAAEPRAH